MTIYNYSVRSAMYWIPVYIVMIVTKITSHPVGLNTHQQFQSRSHHYEHSFVGVAKIDTKTVSPKIAIVKRNPALMRILKRQKTPTRESYILLRTSFKPSSSFMSFQKHFSGMNDIFRTFNLKPSPFILSKNLPNHHQTKAFIRRPNVSFVKKGTHHIPTDKNNKKGTDRYQIKDVHWYGPKVQESVKMSQQTQKQTLNKFGLPLTTNSQEIDKKYYSDEKKSSPVDKQYYSEVKSAPVNKQYHTSVNSSPKDFDRVTVNGRQLQQVNSLGKNIGLNQQTTNQNVYQHTEKTGQETERRTKPHDKNYHEHHLKQEMDGNSRLTNTKQEQFAIQGIAANSNGNSGIWKNRGTSGFVDRFTAKKNNDGYGHSRMQQSNKVIHHTSNNDVKHSGNIPNYTQQKESNSKISYPLISGKKTADTGYSESIISKSTNMANTQVKSYNKINSLDHSNNVNGQLQNNNDYGDNSRYIQHGRDNDVSFARRTQSNQSSDITERIQHQTMRRRRTENGMESKQMQQSKRNDGVAKYAQQAIQSNDQGYNVAGSGIAQQDQGYNVAGNGIAQQAIQSNDQGYNVAGSSIAQQAIQSNDQGYNVAGSGIAQQDQRYNVAGNGIAQQAIQSNDQGYNVAGSGIAQQDQGYNVAGNGIAQQAIQHNGQVYDAAGSGVRESQLAESRNFNHRSNQNVVKNQMEKSANNQYTKDSNSKTEYIQEKSQSSGHSYGEINKQQLKQTGEKSYHMLKTTQTGDNLYGQIKLPQTTDIDGNGRYIHQTGGSNYDSTKDGLQLSKQSMHTGINNYGRSNDGVQNSKTDGNAGYLHQTSQTGGAKTNYGLTNSEFLQAITGGGDSWYSPRTTQTGDNQYGPENARISKSTETAKHIDTENMKHQSGTNTEKTVDSNFGFSQGSDSYDSKQQRVQIQNSYGRSTFMDNDNINGQTQLQLVENLGQSSQLQENMGQTSQLPVNLGKTSQVQERGGYKEHRVMQASNIHAPLSSKQIGNGYITSKVSQIPNDNVNNNFKQRIQSPIIVLSKGDSSFNQINENSHNGAQMPGAVLKDIVESHEVKRIYGNAIEKVNPTNVNVAKRKNVETTGAYRKTENVYHSGHKYGFNTESTRATEVYGNKIEKLNPTGLYKAKIEKPQSPEVYRMNKDNVKPTVTENIVMKLSSPSTYRRYK